MLTLLRDFGLYECEVISIDMIMLLRDFGIIFMSICVFWEPG
jgi:hypothetical protein